MAQDGDRCLPEIEVVDAGDGEIRTEGSVVASGGESRLRWIVGGAALLVLAAIVAVSVSDGDPGAEGSAPSPSATSSSSASTAPTTTVVPGSPGRYLDEGPAPLLGGPIAATVLLGSVEDGWGHLDPDTGWMQPVPELGRADPEWVSAVAGGVVVRDLRPRGPVLLRLPVPVPGDGDAPATTDLMPAATDELAGILAALPTGAEGEGGGRLDRMWIVTEPIRPGAPDFVVTLVDLDGRRLIEPFPLDASPLFATAAGLVSNAGGRTFLAGPDGTVDLGPGQVFAAARNHAGRIRCDAAFACRQEILDLRTGEVVRGSSIPSEPAASGAVTMAQADDGSIATLPTRIPAAGLPTIEGAPATTLHVTRPDGRSMELTITHALTRPAWLPGDRGLVILTGLGLVHVTEVDGELSSTRIPQLSPGGATAVVVVPEG